MRVEEKGKKGEIKMPGRKPKNVPTEKRKKVAIHSKFKVNEQRKFNEAKTERSEKGEMQ